VYSRKLLLHLRTSLIVVAVVAVGLLLYAQSNGEAVQWDLVLYVAIGMLVSSLVNTWIEVKKERKNSKF
jgi:hypothetical protein